MKPEISRLSLRAKRSSSETLLQWPHTVRQRSDNPAYGLSHIIACCSGNIPGSLPQPIGAQPAGFQIINRLGVAKAHALRISMAKITFEHTAALRIPLGRSEWTGRDAHFTADAQLVVNTDALQFFIAENSVFRSHRHAVGIFALLAAHGDIDPVSFPFDNLNAGQRRVADPVVHNRTDEFTIAAARTFFRIYRQYFLVHHLSLLSKRTRSFSAGSLQCRFPGQVVHLNERIECAILPFKTFLSS